MNDERPPSLRMSSRGLVALGTIAIAILGYLLAMEHRQHLA